MSTYVKNPYRYTFNRIMNQEIGRQNQNFGERLEYYIDKHNLDIADIVKICKVMSKKTGVKVTYSDLYGYINYRVSPKMDKLCVLSKVLNLPVEYLCGYGPKH